MESISSYLWLASVILIIIVLVPIYLKKCLKIDLKEFVLTNLLSMFLNLIILIGCVISVKARLCFNLDSEKQICYFNGNPINYPTLFTLSTFLFGIILSFDVHIYDQIEPKYGNDSQVDLKRIYKRIWFLCRMFFVVTVNIISTIYNLAWIQFPWYTPLEMLATTFINNYCYIFIEVLHYQGKMWFNRIKYDMNEN